MKRGRPGTPGFVGPRLRSAREARGITTSSLAAMIGVTRQAVGQYETGAQTPSPEVLERLRSVLNVQSTFFTKTWNPGEAGPLFFRSLASATKTARRRAEERHLWLTELCGYLEQYVALPEVNLPNRLPPQAWATLSMAEVEALAEQTRRAWGLGDGVISNVTTLLENHGIIVSATSMWSDALDAFSRWSASRPFITLDTPVVSASRGRMNLAHELGHLILHAGVTVEVLGDRQAFKLIEDQAWRFAGAFMFPESSFRAEIRWPSLDAFRMVKSKWKVSIAAMIVRARDLGLVAADVEASMWRNLSRRGWKAVEPLDHELESESPRVLSEALRLIVESGVRTPGDILHDTGFADTDICDLAGVARDFFVPQNPKVRLLQFPSGARLNP